MDFGGFQPVLFSDNDLITAKTFLAGATVNTTNDEAIITQPTVGSPIIVAREGSQAAGTSSGVVYGAVEANSVNDSGLIALNGFVTGPGVDPTNNRGVWLSQQGGTTTLIARSGNAAPGAGGALYNSVGSPSLNFNGDLIFSGSLIGTGVNFTNGFGVWKQPAGGVPQLFVRADTQSPGAPAGENYGVFFEPLINAGGSAAFGGELIGATVQPLEKRAVWTENLPSPIDLRLRGGDTSPDVPVDVKFSTINSPAFNSSGTFVVPALLTGPGINFNNRDVLVGKTIDGDARILARTGVMFDVDDDPNVTDMRLVLNPIQFIELSGGEDGRPTGLSENGQAAFTLNFQQTFSGVFVATFADSDCVADVNGDGMLTPTDFTAWINAFNNNLPECDQNADGACTPTDFTAWIANFNAGC